MFKVQKGKNIPSTKEKKSQGFLHMILLGSGDIRGSGDITAHPF